MEESSESPSAQHVTCIGLTWLALHWPLGLHWMDFYCNHGVFILVLLMMQIESRRIIVLIMLDCHSQPTSFTSHISYEPAFKLSPTFICK